MTNYQVEVRNFFENYYPDFPSSWEFTTFDVQIERQITAYGGTYLEAASNFEKELRGQRDSYWRRVRQAELRQGSVPSTEDWNIPV